MKEKTIGCSLVRRMLFVSYPGMCLLDLTGPQTVFWRATRILEDGGRAGYEIATCSLSGGGISTVEGVVLGSSKLELFLSDEFDTVLIPGTPDIVSVLEESDEILRVLSPVLATSGRVASVCTGAFFLAKCGVLSGKRAVTHWAFCDIFQQMFPEVIVEPDAIFIQQKRVWTCAGVTAGIDLALALVEADHGYDVAMKVAREMVVFMRRSGGQSQFSTVLQAQIKDSNIFDDLHEWLVANIHRVDLSINCLAQKMNMSQRTFSRIYKSKTGTTPGKAIERFRIQAAQKLLEDSMLDIASVAERCGFNSESHMQSAFRHTLKTTANLYRLRFAR
jgi:transcriptional regulator GlxA family with amidase domain